ncbi:hypothetical protein BDZ91DRAFT_789320 [Kalaharituber pfeilii]|nr:hypothetical protein BDZ91DRAFT_789320 [Kalaharituber pfeilii]
MASGSKICENVLEVVGSAISYEISRLTQSKLMKKPMKSYTPELINNFSIDSLVEEMKRIAPITLDILRRAGAGTRLAEDSGLETNEDIVGSSNGVPKIGRWKRNKNLIITTAICLIGYSRSKNCNFLQGMMGYFLLAGNVGKRQIEVCHKLGLSVSYETVITLMKYMSAASMATYQARAQTEASEFYCGIHVLPRALLDKELELLPAAYIDREAGRQLVAEDLALGEDTLDYFKKSALGHITSVLEKYYPEAMRGIFSYWKEEKPKYQALKERKVMKTEIFTLPTMDLNENRIPEVIKILETLAAEVKLPMDEVLANRVVLVEGDWLTIRNVLISMFQRQDDLLENRLSWIEPTVGLFHLQMTILKMILRTHMGSTREPGSLKRFIVLLGRNRVEEKVKDFRACDQFMKVITDANILSACMEKFNCTADFLKERLRQVNPLPLMKELVEDVFGMGTVAALRVDPETGSARPKEQRDLVYENSMLLLQHALVYMDYIHAVRRGDPVNPSGRHGGWMPADLFGEYVVRENKDKIHPGANAHTYDHLREIVARQVMSIRDVKHVMFNECNATNYGTHSQLMNITRDVDYVRKILCDESMYTKVPGGRFDGGLGEVFSEVNDLYTLGVRKVLSGQAIERYMTRARCNWDQVGA